VYRPVVDRFAVHVPLDPPAAIFFASVFIVAAAVTARRPAYGLAGLFVIAPVAFAHQFFGTEITISKVAVLGVLLGCTTFAGSWRVLRRSPGPLFLGALAFVFVATALTATGAAYRAPVARETLKIVEYAAFFMAAFLCRSLDRDDVPVIGAIALAAILVSVSALLQEVVGAPSGLYIGSAIVPRIAGLLEGPNQLSGYYEIVLAAAGSWALVRRWALLRAALAVSVCADILTFSRAGWIGLAIVAIALILAGGAKARALWPGALGLVAGIAGAAGWAIYAHTPAVLRASLESSLYAGGVGNRGELWRAAARMWRTHPVLGVGAGNFELVLPAYGVPGVRTHANSWYLQSLAEGGLVLFTASIALIGATLGGLIDSRPLASLRTASPWVLAGVIATIALALHQTVDYLFFYPKVGGTWWLLLGTAAATLATSEP
jgi:O-antigen ligase